MLETRKLVPALVTIGQTCLFSAVLLMFALRWLAGFLKSDEPGGGLSLLGWIIAVPIWVAAGLGVILLIAAFILMPQPDGLFVVGPVCSPLSGLTRVLGCLVMILFTIGIAFAVVNEPEERLPVWLKAILLEYTAAFLFWTFYVCWFFQDRTHLAATLYVSLFGWLFAYLLIPILWPVLIYKGIAWRW